MAKPLIEIARGNTRARIRASDPLVYDEVDDMLSFYSSGYMFSKAFKTHRWDGRTRLMRTSDRSFPAGLVDRVIAEYDGIYAIKVYDQRTKPEPHPKLLDAYLVGDALRESQEEATLVALEEGQGVFEAATGWGKTTLLTSIIARQQVPCLIFVNRNELAAQTVKRLRTLIRFPHADDPFGIIGGGKWQPGLITVSTYQTLGAMLRSARKDLLEYLSVFKAVHIDEAQHVTAKTQYNLTKALDSCYYRFGYSATPFKNKEAELRLVGLCGEIIYSFNAKRAIEEGILAPPHIYYVQPEFEELDGQDIDGRYVGGRFAKEYKLGVAEHRARNKLIAKIAEACAARKHPTLVLVQSIQHGRTLNRLIEESEFVYGKHSLQERQDAMNDLASGKLPVLIASSIFDEGVDVPGIGALIIAGGYKAKHKSIQRVGRGLRTSPGKKHVLVFDFCDDHAEHLGKHSRARFSTYKKQGFKVQPVSPDKLTTLMAREDFWGVVPGHTRS